MSSIQHFQARVGSSKPACANHESFTIAIPLRAVAYNTVNLHGLYSADQESEPHPASKSNAQPPLIGNHASAQCRVCRRPIHTSSSSESSRGKTQEDNVCFCKSVEATSRGQFSRSYASEMASMYSETLLSSSSIRVLDLLDIPQDLERSKMHQLFHNWFMVEAPMHLTVPHPTHMKNDLLHSPFFAPAFSSPALCLSILAVSAASQCRVWSGPDKVLALNLLSRALKQLREDVQDTEDLVTEVTIVAATYLWTANLYFPDEAILQRHANGVRAMIKGRGGQITQYMAGAVANLVRWVDIADALRSNRISVPAKTSQSETSHSRVLPAPRHGNMWRIGKLPTLDQAVITAHQQCCTIIHLIAQSGLTITDPKTYIQVCEHVARLYQENSVSRVRYAVTGTIEACIVLAIDIVKLVVFNGAHLHSGRRLLALQIKFLETAIQAVLETCDWQIEVELFIWFMCLVHINVSDGQCRAQSFCELRAMLKSRYKVCEVWSTTMIIELQGLLFSYGWSTGSPFDEVLLRCGRIQQQGQCV